MQYTLTLDTSTENNFRTLLCLYLLELLRYRFVAVTAHARAVRAPYALSVLLAYLCVTYALTVGIVKGDYAASVAWCASVGVLAWGVCNAVLMNLSPTWSRQMAEDDTLAGIIYCVLAGVAGANALNVWYLAAAVGCIMFLNQDLSTASTSGFLPLQALTSMEVQISVSIKGKFPHVHGGTVIYQHQGKVFQVALNEGKKRYFDPVYTAAVLAAVQASHSGVQNIVDSQENIIENVNIDNIRSDQNLQHLIATS